MLQNNWAMIRLGCFKLITENIKEYMHEFTREHTFV